MLEVTSLTMGLPKAWSRVNKHIRIRAAYRFVNIDMISICLKKYRYTDTIVRTGAYRKGHNSSTKFQNVSFSRSIWIKDELFDLIFQQL